MVVPIFVISGPSGSGKTTVSQSISEIESFAFVEGDDLHPQKNIDKMSSGHPLTDEDRWDWLRDVKDKALELARQDGSLGVAITCSSLKRKYRDVLAQANREPDVALFFVFLKVSEAELVRRMESRKGHYMKRSMLDSQLRDLEMPGDDEDRCYVVDADVSIAETTTGVLKVVANLMAKVNKESEQQAS